ncbi:hypothetical protein KGP36_03040 [Patescibacteria group bacterium]|nr:hypothetical protein [Patescibacteria group bacterium]
MTSLRQHLISQGVDDEAALRRHLLFIHKTQLRVSGKINLLRYRVNPDNPNDAPLMQG